MAFRSARPTTKQSAHSMGQLAEDLVAQWLIGQSYQIVARRWHCCWGELDLVALTPDKILVFVEVKARSRGNWDAGGRLAVTPKKQIKLTRSAQSFLAMQPQLAEHPCRFDVAIVHCRMIRPQNCPPITVCPPVTDEPLPPLTNPVPELLSPPVPPVTIGQSQIVGTHCLTLQDYIPAAFE